MNERFKRPEPARTGPVRNWSTVFGPIPAGGAGAPPPRPGVPADPVARGVEAGYRVIDDYLRRGQAAARAVWSPFLPNGAPPEGPSDSPPWMGAQPPFRGAPPMSEEAQARMGTMLRAATDLAMMWMDFVGRGVMSPSAPGHVPPPAGAAAAGPFTSNAEPPVRPEAPAPTAPVATGREAADRAAVTVEIDARSRVEVTVDMRAPTPGRSLRVLALRAAEGDAHFGGVTAEPLPEGDHVIFRITVPPEIPPGVYVGGVLDARTSIAIGWLTVRVHEAQRAAE